MAIDDKIEKALEGLAQESQLNLFGELVFMTISGIPGAGGPIATLLGGQAKRRILERAIEVFDAMKERLEEVEEATIDKKFFESEEFQSLLALALEQLQTTHDKAKLKMLASALANGGLPAFSCETHKELFLRILRDLSPEHLETLKDLLPQHPQALNLRRLSFLPQVSDPKGAKLATLQNLAAHALVEESLREAETFPVHRLRNQSSVEGAIDTVKEFLEKPPIKCYRMSKFGLDFMAYLGQAEVPKDEA